MFDSFSNPKVERKLDPKMFGMVVIIGAGVIMAIAGDQATFLHEPRNLFERLCSVLTGLLYLVFRERLVASVGAGFVYVAILAILAMVLWRTVERKIIEPMMFRKMIDSKKRLKSFLDKEGDDTM
jgi:hypothetical protein